MLQNAYFLAKIGADTAENEQHVAEILPTDALGRRRVRPHVRKQRTSMSGRSSHALTLDPLCSIGEP